MGQKVSDIGIMLKSKESKTKFDIDTHLFFEGR